MSVSTQKVRRASQFTESTWLDLANHVASAFRLTKEETDILRSSQVAKLIAAIPYLAGCNEPARTSVANLSIYMASVGPAKQFFAPAESDDQDVFARLNLARFDGGDPAIIQRGLSLLAINMVADYKRDAVWDTAHKKHNPIANGTWNYDELYGQLLKNVEAVDCPEMDEIATVPTIVNNYWWTGMGDGGWF
jgi:hypothetical protein